MKNFRLAAPLSEVGLGVNANDNNDNDPKLRRAKVLGG